MDNQEIIAQARERVIESVAQNMHLYGVTPSIGRIYGTLYFENEPMTLDALKEELHMSKTSMSTGVRTLIDLDMVEKVWRKGERKDLYQIKADWYQNFIDRFCAQWRKGTQMNMGALTKSLSDFKNVIAHAPNEDVAEQAKKDIDKVTYAISYYNWLNQVIDLFESKEIFKLTNKDNEI
ncbi:GbsR/MarR family transcriptional regulator [Alkalihalobacillus sp. AL-G]|uniref:GbsR/MarR family transcriptional regulator n=1 Tax=Alkalihalobacillus sp. AL-G TaxID=2926399 RepID=UPI00272A6BA7|nr:GbsR/MarR family transcriptional regulator [Alkalihalobacillus sp. AL-G]WLD93616.1 GbsR/MarR family transcriptional regulator [Alkalihalobacillus sp. AL-G]